MLYTFLLILRVFHKVSLYICFIIVKGFLFCGTSLQYILNLVRAWETGVWITLLSDGLNMFKMLRPY